MLEIATPLLKLRLRRQGAKKQPTYRLVVAESTSPRDGTFLENLGHYNPLTTPTTFEIKEDRVREWLQKGAQPTERVARLLSARGLVNAPSQTRGTGANAPKSGAASSPAAASPATASPATPSPATATAPTETAPAANADEAAQAADSGEPSV